MTSLFRVNMRCKLAIRVNLDNIHFFVAMLACYSPMVLLVLFFSRGGGHIFNKPLGKSQLGLLSSKCKAKLCLSSAWDAVVCLSAESIALCHCKCRFHACRLTWGSKLEPHVWLASFLNFTLVATTNAKAISLIEQQCAKCKSSAN